MFRSLTRPQLAFDIGLAVLCFLFGLLVYSNGAFGSSIALVGMAAALALRRFSPALALTLAWATSVVQVIFAIGPDPSNLAILPVLYATARYGIPPVKWIGLGSTAAGAFVIAGYATFGPVIGFRFNGGNQSFLSFPHVIVSFGIVFFSAFAVFALSWTFGLLAKTWSGAREESQARIIAERRRIDAQRSVVLEQERNRIARDMHDVVAHSLAVVIAQADGARYARESDPDAVDAALSTISATAREALGDVRILLGQLRHSQDEAPQPVLADLDRLLEQFRASGLRVTFRESGEPLALATGAQLAAYRIIQEALTNALRHGDSTREATVALTWESDAIAIEVSSSLAPDAAAGADARPPAHPNTSRPDASRPDASESTAQGHGLAGMTERAVLAGGTLSAGAEEDSFVVSASIPATTAEVPA
jgi:signal transduction histidine kinase